jgi:putative endonuclease
VTSDLEQRILQHKNRLIPGFTCRYNIDRLVYYEEFSRVQDAIAREKEMKGWVRSKKVALIESINATWEDLSKAWF